MYTTPHQTDLKNLRHLLCIEDLNREIITQILDKAETYFTQDGKLKNSNELHNQTVVNLFFEPSTRTRATFELAAKRLSATVLNLNVSTSSTTKGESLQDMVQNLEAMQCNFLVLRHSENGSAQFVAQHTKTLHVINAGDGTHAHPTQALLDMFTIRKHRKDFEKLTVAIVGDIKHSRVARSQIQALHLLNTKEIRVIGPQALLPTFKETLNIKTFHNLQEGLQNVDVIIMLRIQRERMPNDLLPPDDDYYQQYGLTEKSLQYANPKALIMHPGPINRGVEIQSELTKHPNAVILDQVTNGLAIRMAVMSILQENTVN